MYVCGTHILSRQDPHMIVRLGIIVLPPCLGAGGVVAGGGAGEHLEENCDGNVFV